MLSVHLPQPDREIDWHMAGVGHWMLLLLLSVTACILPVSAQEPAAPWKSTDCHSVGLLG